MKQSVGVIDKTVFILSTIAQGNSHTLSDIVTLTTIPKSTAHRILCSLEQHQFVVKNENGYNLGARFIGLVKNSSYNNLIDLSKSVLVELSDKTKESTQLYVKEGNERVCIASIEPKTGLKNTVPVGSVFPLNLGSAGKVLSNSNKLLNDGHISWIQSISERDVGVASVSAAVYNGNNEMVAAVSVSGPISRMGSEPGEEFGSFVVEAAIKITESLKEHNHN